MAPILAPLYAPDNSEFSIKLTEFRIKNISLERWIQYLFPPDTPPPPRKPRAYSSESDESSCPSESSESEIYSSSDSELGSCE